MRRMRIALCHRTSSGVPRMCNARGVRRPAACSMGSMPRDRIRSDGASEFLLRIALLPTPIA